jgi:hypothetical protein
MEFQFSDINKCINSLEFKYKIMTEENSKLEEQRYILLNQCRQLEKNNDETLKELYIRYDEIKRYKEIDKCLVDYAINSCCLNTDKKISKNSTSTTSGNIPTNNTNISPPCIKCEPIPTFAMFLYKHTGAK